MSHTESYRKSRWPTESKGELSTQRCVVGTSSTADTKSVVRRSMSVAEIT